jgi:hypothetical protein
MSISATVTLTVSATDGTTSVLSKSSPVTLTLNLIDYSSAFNITTSSTPLILPVTPVQFVYIKNIGSTNNLQVTWTPTGGASAIIQTLTPGSPITFGQFTTGQGVTAISVQAITAATQIEYIIGS